jgi:hypothetical protein
MHITYHNSNLPTAALFLPHVIMTRRLLLCASCPDLNSRVTSTLFVERGRCH